MESSLIAQKPIYDGVISEICNIKSADDPMAQQSSFRRLFMLSDERKIC